MKLGIVGTGTIVEEVLPVLQQVKGLSCYGICGTKRSEAKAEKLKEQYQMQLAVSDYEKLLDSEIDTVYIACLLYTSPSPRDGLLSRMPSSA